MSTNKNFKIVYPIYRADELLHHAFQLKPKLNGLEAQKMALQSAKGLRDHYALVAKYISIQIKETQRIDSTNNINPK